MFLDPNFFVLKIFLPQHFPPQHSLDPDLFYRFGPVFLAAMGSSRSDVVTQVVHLLVH